MALFSFVLANPGGGGLEILELDSAFAKTYMVSLADGCVGSFSLTSGTNEEQAIIVGVHDIKIYRGHELIGRGRIVSAERSGGEDSTRTYNFVGYKQLLDRKKIYATDTAATTGYTGIDMELVGWNLINDSQTKYSGAGANSFNITRAGIATGRIISGTKVFTPGESVRAALDEIAQTEAVATPDSGWEWDIRGEGDDLVYYAWYPRRGKLSYDSTVVGEKANYIFDNQSSVIDFHENFDFSTFANVITIQGSAGKNEVQLVNTDTPTAGTFTLSFRGVTSGTIAWNADLSVIQAALESLSTIGPGNVLVQGSIPSIGNFTVTFQAGLGLRNVPALGLSGGGLTGSISGNRSVTVVGAEGSYYTSTVFSSDYQTSPYGTVEYYAYDADLTDPTSIDERAAYLLRIMSVYTPTITFEIDSDDYDGKSSFWIGDYVLVSIQDKGFSINRNDLRVTEIHFAIGDNGEESITPTVEILVPIDRTANNLARRIAAKEASDKAKLAAVARAKMIQRRALEKKLAVLIKQATALHKSKASVAKIEANMALQSKLYVLINRLK